MNPAESVKPLLEVAGLTAGYTPVPVVHEVSFAVGPGEYLGVVGSNGAGKSALMQAMAGLLRTQSGQLTLEGRELTHATPWKRWLAGIALVPEARELFGQLTVEDHLRAGVVDVRGVRGAEAVELGVELFPTLRPLLGRQARQLSGGQQQTVAIARAVVARPRVLLLDEPSLGLSPIAVEHLVESLGGMRELGHMAVVIAEQSLTVVRETCERVLVLNLGNQIGLGPAETVLTRSVIESVFL